MKLFTNVKAKKPQFKPINGDPVVGTSSKNKNYLILHLALYIMKKRKALIYVVKLLLIKL